MPTGDSSTIRRSGLLVTIYGDAAAAWSVASRDICLPPPGYRLASVLSSYRVSSVSGTYAVRKITDTSAPSAAASSTVIELLATPTVTTGGTANFVQKPPLTAVAGALTFKLGDRIAVDFAGTVTNLAGLVIQLEFVPSNRYGVS